MKAEILISDLVELLKLVNHGNLRAERAQQVIMQLKNKFCFSRCLCIVGLH